ncbi:MAG: HAD superfamily hydrolase (TIGR01549 family) [Paracoccaceae bacterium]|jgi:HAD superfamily hydrolase (TIGR01549 family)
MSAGFEGTKVVCFDLGNTLIEFGPRQIAMQYERLTAKLVEMFGSCDATKLKEIRDQQIVAPYHAHYRENDVEECCRELIEGIYPVTATDEQVQELAEERYRVFVDMIELADEILPLLGALSERYRLALLSNFPCGRSIRDGITKLGMTEHFDAIVVSGEVGWVKPDPRPYRALLEQLKRDPAECIYVGDNWLADVQGSKNIGMKSILTTEHLPYERFEPKPGDHQPDQKISHISELRNLLLG